jgi:hypothetical protein
MATLIENLNKISECKIAIKDALCEVVGDAHVGDKTMKDAIFEDYADIIKGLQLPSDDSDTPSEPSTPTPSEGYIFSNGYPIGSDPITIVDNTIHEISFDENGKFSIDVICPVELKGSSSKNIYDTIFTVDVPQQYELEKNLFVEYYDKGTSEYYKRYMKPNPRHSTIIRNGVVYNSYVRAVDDEKDQGSTYVSSLPLQYKITIVK